MTKVSIVPPVDSKYVTKNNSYLNDLLIVQCCNYLANDVFLSDYSESLHSPSKDMPD